VAEAVDQACGPAAAEPGPTPRADQPGQVGAVVGGFAGAAPARRARRTAPWPSGVSGALRCTTPPGSVCCVRQLHAYPGGRSLHGCQQPPQGATPRAGSRSRDVAELEQLGVGDDLRARPPQQSQLSPLRQTGRPGIPSRDLPARFITLSSLISADRVPDERSHYDPTAGSEQPGALRARGRRRRNQAEWLSLLAAVRAGFRYSNSGS
jgi:hypothetical protein